MSTFKLKKPSYQMSLEEFDADTRECLGIGLESLLRAATLLDRLSRYADQGGADMRRFGGLISSTQAEHPMDCKYVRACVIALFAEPEKFQKLKELVDEAHRCLYEG